MIWNEKTQSYRGQTPDGIIDVAGDEYAEALSEGVKAEASVRGWDHDALTEEQRKICEQETYKQIDDPNEWAALVGDNENVEYIV